MKCSVVQLRMFKVSLLRLILSVVFCGVSVAQAAVFELLPPDPEGEVLTKSARLVPTVQPSAAPVVRQRLAGASGARRTYPAEQDTAVYTFFNDAAHTTRVTRVRQGFGGAQIIEGRAEDSGVRSLSVLTAEGERHEVRNTPNGHVFVAVSRPDGSLAMEEFDPSQAQASCGTDHLQDAQFQERLEAMALEREGGVVAAAEAGGIEIDLMIVLDTAAAAWAKANAGGTAALANSAVSRMNASLANSGIACSIRLVDVYLPEYTGYGSLNASLDDVTFGYGALNGVAAQRNAVGADLVCLMVDSGSRYLYAGLGWVGSIASRAFTACEVRSVNTDSTMTHEIGHNFGCGHSATQTTGPGPGIYPYASGYHFVGTDGARYNTIMAYYYDGTFSDYTECDYFSSPLKTYKGVPVGNAATADNTRCITERRAAVAGFRTSLSSVLITFDAGDGLGSVEMQSFTLGATYFNLPAAARSGYTFDGWYTGVNGTGAKITAASVVVPGITMLYAHWVDGWNDNFAEAQEISGTSGCTAGVTVDATLEEDEPDASGYRGETLWWKWTAPTNALYAFTTKGSWVDTALFVYTGAEIGALVPVANNDNVNAGVLTSSVEFTVVEGTTYYFKVDSRDEAGFVMLNWEPVTFMIDSPGRYVSQEGVSGVINITCLGDWTVTKSAGASWVTYPTASGTGNKAFQFTVAANSGAFRQATLTFSDGKDAHTYRIDQNTLSWKTSKNDALAAAGGKKILLLAGRRGDDKTDSMRNGVCETSTIKTLLKQGYVLWFCDMDSSTEYTPYAAGLESFALPLVCIIDASNANAYFDRTTGVQEANAFRTRLVAATGSYIVTFNAQGGAVSPASKIVSVGALYAALPTPVRSGFVFDGWYTAVNGGGSLITASATMAAARDHTLYAKWITVVSTVTFDAQGGAVSPSTKTISGGGTYETLPVPTRDGFVFDGWYTAVNGGGTRITATTLVTTAVEQTLYAKWVVPTPTVTFNAQGGSVSPGTLVVQTGMLYPALPVPAYTGYSFNGWYTAPNGGGTLITSASTVTAATNHTLYASWQKSYTLTVKDGTAPGTAFLNGAVVAVTANPAPLNKEFQRCTFSPATLLFADGFSTNDAATAIVMPAANVTMTAVYIVAPGSLQMVWQSNVGGQSVSGVEWSTDKKTWFAAASVQRLPAGAYTLSFRSLDGRWFVPASMKVTLNAGSPASPTLVTVPCEFAPAVDEGALGNSTDPNSHQGEWDDVAGQLDWTGLRVGLRAKLGPLPLAANATSAKLKSGKLPAGLKLAALPDGVYITGIPTKAGVYPAVLQAMEGKKLGALLPVSWTVQDLPAEYIGTFNGVYSATTNGVTSHSVLTLTVAKTGKMTGAVTLGGKKYALKADAFDAIDFTTGAVSVTNTGLILGSPKLTNAVSLSVSLSPAGLGMAAVTDTANATGDYIGWGVRNGWADKVKHALRVDTLLWAKGYYTLALTPEDTSYGAGYVTLTVDAKGAVKAAGKLADGTAVSGSSVLLVTDDDVSTVIALSPSAYKGGEFYLNVRFIQDAQTRIESVDSVNWVNSVITATSDGPFVRVPMVQGGWYSTLLNLYSLYSTPLSGFELEAARITDEVAVTFNPAGTGINALPKDNNAYNVKLTLTPKTGLFTGSFNELGIKTAYKVYGVLTPYLVSGADDPAGLGFYSVPVAAPVKTQHSELFTFGAMQ